jgi:hypothetical protein
VGGNGAGLLELFHFIADKISEFQTKNPVIVTKEDIALCNQDIPLQDVSPCSHEEADSRIFVHAMHAAREGYTSLLVKANDTDVVVIGIYVMPTLLELGLQKLWISFGQGTSLRWIPVHEIVSQIGPEKTHGMPFFHAFTGCDLVSAFRGKGKKSAWQTWNVFTDVSTTFAKLTEQPTEFDEDDMHKLERFVVVMYDRSSEATCVNDARLDLFARKQRAYDAIPPTQAALKEHVKRATYQAGCIWSQAIISQPEVHSPSNWGWEKCGEGWTILWTTMPPIATGCQELTKCRCKVACSGNCCCFGYGLPCTALCSCVCQM